MHFKYDPGTYLTYKILSDYEWSRTHKVLMVQVRMVEDHIVLDHKSRPKSPKSRHLCVGCIHTCVTQACRRLNTSIINRGNQSDISCHHPLKYLMKCVHNWSASSTNLLSACCLSLTKGHDWHGPIDYFTVIPFLSWAGGMYITGLCSKHSICNLHWGTLRCVLHFACNAVTWCINMHCSPTRWWNF